MADSEIRSLVAYKTGNVAIIRYRGSDFVRVVRQNFLSGRYSLEAGNYQQVMDHSKEKSDCRLHQWQTLHAAVYHLVSNNIDI